MLSALKNFLAGIFGAESNSAGLQEEESEEIIVKKILSDQDFETDQLENSFNKLQIARTDSEKLSNKTLCNTHYGKVTYFSDSYGIIDNCFYFEPSQVSETLNVKANDEVVYTAYNCANTNEALRIHKIVALINDLWDDSGEKKVQTQENNVYKSDENYRVISGKVGEKLKRKIFIEPVNIWCNLDEIETSFIPIEGDWVSLEAEIHGGGHISKVKSLEPLLTKNFFGRVTFWCSSREVGAIENSVFFSKTYCDGGYSPSLGDEVECDAIESDQGNYTWRAVKVTPNFQRKENAKKKCHKERQKCFLSKDKNGITISPVRCIVEVELKQTKEVTLEVTNNGNVKQHLQRIKFVKNGTTPQIKLMSPKRNLSIEPKEKIVYKFECFGDLLGLSEEELIFYFDNFVILRTFEINVVESFDLNKLVNDETTEKAKLNIKRYTKNDINQNGNILFPVFSRQNLKQAKFRVGEKRGTYKVPDKLWDAVVGSSENPKSKVVAAKDLEKYAPYLKNNLNIQNYEKRFHLLLFLEEIEQNYVLSQYDVSGVFFREKDGLFVMDCASIAVKSDVMPGDKVLLSRPWMNKKDIVFVGIVKKICGTEIHVEFHPSFEIEKGEFDVSFSPSKSNLAKAHDALKRSIKKLGPQFLFPTSVDEKSPQVLLEVEGEKSRPEERISVRRKKLVWFNKNLNERQKLTVVSVLKGQGRPLPYILFGPPGTGKTVTLVEIIMQIHQCISESRLLVATPSNSAADLICERLIDVGMFKPGQLVRLLAFGRANSGCVPEKLIPYCTTVDTMDGSSDKNDFDWEKKAFLTYNMTGRERITVGTCSSVGSLHYMNFKKVQFTHILVDEAGQLTEPEILISLSFLNPSAGQVVLAGDPKQLGPVCISKLAEHYGLGVSLLERLSLRFPYIKDCSSFSETSGYDPRFITRLNINYRTLPEICSLPNQMFYDSELIPTVSETDSDEAKIVKKFNFTTTARKKPAAIIFHGVCGKNIRKGSASWYNPHEITTVISYVKKCYNIGLTPDDVGVVTPYIKQAQKLHFILTSLKIPIPKIGTVEDFQGQERLAIIVSPVRSSITDLDANTIQCLGFVASPRRLNVALTRARALLIICGNPILLSKDRYWKNVVEYCVKNNSYKGCDLGNLCKDA